MTLNRVKNAAACTVETVPTCSLLQALGIRPGTGLRVVVRQPLGGPVVVKLGQREVAVSAEYARQIRVKEAL